MTYVLLNIVFAVPVTLLVWWAWARRREQLPPVQAYVIALVVLIVDTAVFDNVLIAVGIVDYDPNLILGIKVLLAPVEDFAYSIAACFLLPALWVLLPDKPRSRARSLPRQAR